MNIMAARRVSILLKLVTSDKLRVTSVAMHRYAGADLQSVPNVIPLSTIRSEKCKLYAERGTMQFPVVPKSDSD